MGRSRSNLPFLAATEFEDQVCPLFEAKGRRRVEERALWGTQTDADGRPLCINGSWK